MIRAFDFVRCYTEHIGENEHRLIGSPTNAYLRRLFAQGQVKVNDEICRNPDEEYEEIKHLKVGDRTLY